MVEPRDPKTLSDCERTGLRESMMHPGPVGFGDSLQEEMAEHRRRERQHEEDCADEQGLTLAEYRRFVLKEDERQKAREAQYADPVWRAAQAKETVTRHRRIVGLPDGVLPDLQTVMVNGGVGVKMPGETTYHFGPFSVSADGRELIRQ